MALHLEQANCSGLRSCDELKPNQGPSSSSVPENGKPQTHYHANHIFALNIGTSYWNWSVTASGVRISLLTPYPVLCKLNYCNYMAKKDKDHLVTVSSLVADCTNVDRPCAIRRWGQEVHTVTLEMEVLLVKSAIVDSTPRHAGAWALRDPASTK